MLSIHLFQIFTSRQIYRLAPLFCAPEALLSLRKSKISLFNVHIAHIFAEE